MFKKNKDASNTPVKTEKPAKAPKEPKQKPVKEPKQPKPPKEPKPPKHKKDARGAKVEQELSEVAKSHNIRVSSPYGYYPEDVDPIIVQLETAVSQLTKENKQLATQLHEEQTLRQAASQELAKMKMEVSLFDYPDVSAEESFAMLGRIDSITGNYDSEPVSELQQRFGSQPQPQSPPSNSPKPKIKIKPKST